MGVKALYYNCIDIGKHVKKSKKRFIWKFSIDGREHTIDLVISYLSGKKKITQDGKLLYEGQKVLTSSFQFPFEIDLNMCNIVQQGDNFELRINNQAFSELYGSGGGSRSGFEGEYKSSKSKKGFEDDYEYRGDYSGTSSKGYGGSGPNYSGSRSGGDYGGYGSKDSSGGYGHKANLDSSYKKPNESSNPRAKGWDDVRQAAKGVRTGNTAQEERELGFEHGFDKFEPPKDNFRRQETEKKAAQGGAKTGFDDFGSQPQPNKKDDFTDFSSFNNFSQNTTQPKNKPDQQFSGFGNFGDFNQSQIKPPENKRPQNTQPTADILGLDFSGGNNQIQNNAPPKNNQAGGFDDFFGQSNQPTNNNQNQGGFNQGFNQPQKQQPSTNPSDLLALDFGNLNVQTTTTTQSTTVTTNTQGLDLFADQPQPQTQSQPQQNSQNQNQNQQVQPSKKDLWSTDLVSLDATEVGNNNKGGQLANQNNNFNNFGNKQGGGYGGGFGNQGMGFNQGMGMNTNTGFGGMGMNTNANFGGMNSNANFGGMNMGFGMGMNNNMSNMNNNANFGGMNGGFNMGFNAQNQNQGGLGMGGGFQQQFPQQQAVTANQGGNVSTPFDF